MQALDKKLFRDLVQMKGQALAIALVLASGIAMFIMSLTAYRSLDYTMNRYYRDNRFADVFAYCKRAPLALQEKIAEIPGVGMVEPRIVREVPLDIAFMDKVANARMVSIPVPYRPSLNEPHIVKGRRPEAGRDEEVMISEPFAIANRFEIGDHIDAVINGRKQTLRVVGTALSPEFIYSIRQGDALPDEKHFGIFWIAEKALAASMNMEGGFNNVSVTLTHGASPDEVVDRLKSILKPYGGTDAIKREFQISHWFLSNELTQLQTMAYFIPLIFFAVAVFLLNIVLSRMISNQREQIAVLKAFGYTNLRVGVHFVEMVLVIVLTATVGGSLAGLWLGKGMTQLYAEFYKFPVLYFRIDPKLFSAAFFFSGLAAVCGTVLTVRTAVKLPPAEAMRPEPPASFRPTLIERLGLGRFLSPQWRMILRHLERHPVRGTFSVLGIALGVSVMVLGRFNVDAIDRLLLVQFDQMQRQDASIYFYEPMGRSALHEIRNLPGVIYAEPVRSLPVRIRNGHMDRASAILGMVDQPKYQRPLDKDLRLIELPEQGLIMGQKMAEVLGFQIGDLVEAEILEGDRRTIHVPLAGLVQEYIGTNMYMNIESLHRTMGEDGNLTGAYIEYDGSQERDLFRRLKETPLVASVSTTESALESFKKTMAENLLIMTFFTILFSCIIAVGVVYNSAQMSLQERARDLGTLRVLGFTRAEISTVLLGELAVITLASLPVGCFLGYLITLSMVQGMQTEYIRIPFVISQQTYVYSGLIIMVAALISGLIVRRKLDRLDLIKVLKTRE